MKQYKNVVSNPKTQLSFQNPRMSQVLQTWQKEKNIKKTPLAVLPLSIFPMHKSIPICNFCLPLAAVLLLISMCCTFGKLSSFHLPFIPFTTSFVIGLVQQTAALWEFAAHLTYGTGSLAKMAE